MLLNQSTLDLHTISMFKHLKLIIHQLEKKVEQNEARWFKSDILAGVNSNDNGLLEKMVKSFNREGVFSGSWDNPSEHPFVTSFRTYLFGGRTEQSFVEFSKVAADQLLPLLHKKGGAKGGFYVFVEFEREVTAPYLGIFLIRETESRTFRRDETTHSLQLQPAIEMELVNMAMGCQIDYVAHRSDQPCLTFTQQRNKEVSEYFIDWVGCVNRKSPKAATQDFHNLVRAIPDRMPNNPFTEKQMTPSEFLAAVKDMTKTQANPEVDILHISKHYFGDSQFLQNQAYEQQLPLDTLFNYHQETYKKDMSVEVKDENLDLKLKFPKTQFGDGKPVNITGREGEKILVIKSQALIQQILNKMNPAPDGTRN